MTFLLPQTPARDFDPHAPSTAAIPQAATLPSGPARAPGSGRSAP